jgi:SAM-dependent methyltransferase
VPWDDERSTLGDHGPRPNCLIDRSATADVTWPRHYRRRVPSAPAPPPSPDRFDAAYYRRFYGRRPVHDRARIAQLATAVTAFAAWWRIPVRSVLDVGAGKGFWRDWLAAERPRVRYEGIDVSEYACRRYGHTRADLATWRPTRRYDLVVCHSVLQYLDGVEAAHAIDALGEASRGLLFLEVPTSADRTDVVDPSGTDLDVHWRSGAWYRARLDRHFVELGCGLWASRLQPVPFFELERSTTR